jgi:alpha-beta hydrolase superfamily lysophospholipase
MRRFCLLTHVAGSFPDRAALASSAVKINPLIEKMRQGIHAGIMGTGFFKTSDGFPLFFRQWKGNEQATPEKIIVCIHGLHSHGEKFVLLADQFSSLNWCTIAIDLRGHGLSWNTIETRGDIPDYEIWVRDVKEFIETLNAIYPTSKVFLVAESMGAAVAIHVVKHLESKIRGIVLLSPAVKPWKEFEFSMIMEAFTFALLSTPERGMIPNFGRSKLSSNCPEYMQYQLEDPLRLPKVSPRYYYQIVKMIHQLRAWSYDTFVSTCSFYGEKDHLVTFDGVVKFIGLIKCKDKALFYVPRAFHDLLTDHAARAYRIYDKIEWWIREQD